MKNKNKNNNNNNNYKFILELLKIEDGIIKLSNIEINDKNHAKELIHSLEKLYKDLNIFNDKGYLNDPNINIPIAEFLVKELKIDKKKELKIDKKGKSIMSIRLNTLYYNMVLLFMKKLVINIESKLITLITSENDLDLLSDIKILNNDITRMIHPFIISKLENKGITVLLNTIVGYDSEYELISSIEKTNELLSVQLASNTSIYIKVPIINTDNLNPYDLPIWDKPLWNENKKIAQCCVSMDLVIKEIREHLYSENDLLLDKIRSKLEEDNNVKKWDMNDFHLYTFPKTSVETLIKYVNEYNSIDLIKDSEALKEFEHFRALNNFIELLNVITGKEEISKKMLKSIHNSVSKPKSRIVYKFNENNSRLNITINRTLYLCMHESAADLSMLKDFEILKESLDIIDRSFVTRGKPLEFEFSKSRIHLRDTILLAPQGAKSLAGVGDIYGDEFRKIDIGSYRNGNMKALLKDDKNLFAEYALRDSLITLKHANSMEEFNLTVNKIGVPLTLSGIAKSYVIKEWNTERYEGYQVRNDIMIGNLMNRITPKDARGTELSKYLISYIAGYRGGRNESMMYGIDIINNEERSWFDYDLTSCYTTVMSILGHPNVDKARRIFNKTVINMSNEDLLFNYIVVDVDFEFNNKTKYPCIPCRVDDNVDIYPIKGNSIITGCEYLVAKSMGCRLYVNDGILIPFNIDEKAREKAKARLKEREREREREKEKEKEEEKEKEYKNQISTDTRNIRDIEKEPDKHLNKYVLDYEAPFRSIIKGLQNKRRAHKKKTFYNYMYKEIGNSIYGQIAMGLSGNNSYDIKTRSYVRREGGLLSNPILSSYITGYTRALIGECMHNIHLIGGKIVSVTTDGFITDVEDLENKLLALKNDNLHCLYLYRDVRNLLTNFKDQLADNRAWEIKNKETLGLLSWKTRGQLGFTNGGISAATGFQTRFYEKEFLIDEFSKNMKGTKVFEFIESSLRSASDIYKYGGNVIRKYRDKKFSIEYDNKRCIIEQDSNMLDSMPWKTVNQYSKIRQLKQTVNTPVYDGKGFTQNVPKIYKCYIETAIRGFIKACLSSVDQNRYGIPKDLFNSYQSIIDFVYKHEPATEVKLTLNNIAQLKRRQTISRAVPRTKENEAFIDYVKDKINTFESDRFFREYSNEMVKEMVKERKIKDSR